MKFTCTSLSLSLSFSAPILQIENIVHCAVHVTNEDGDGCMPQELMTEKRDEEKVAVGATAAASSAANESQAQLRKILQTINFNDGVRNILINRCAQTSLHWVDRRQSQCMYECTNVRSNLVNRREPVKILKY